MAVMSAEVTAPSPFTSSWLLGCITVTLQNAESPLSVLAMIVASPGDRAVTIPVLLTVATSGLADNQLIDAAEPDGCSVGVKEVDSPTVKLIVEGKVMLVGLTLLTVIWQ